MHNSSFSDCFVNRRLPLRLRLNLRLTLLLLLLVVWCTSGVSLADTIQYRIEFNDPNAFQFDAGSSPYSMNFYLSGSSGTTTISGSNFLGSGTDPSTSFTLNNSTSDSEAFVNFTPPTTSPTSDSLSFDLFANYAPASGDNFSFGIYKNFGAANQDFITTTEGQGISFFTIDFANPSGPFVRTYSSNDPGFNIAAPTVRVVATPEPETWAMMAMGLVALGVLGWKRRRRESSQAEPFTVSI